MAVFYLKYRPKTFAQLDSVEARESLIKLFSKGNVPHALLFTGSRGIGKTSAARIVAKALNCENKDPQQNTYEPCNNCPSCLSVENGSCVDIMEIDAASNRGIDDIRDLREKIKLAPSGSRYKVYIIDEVHMLTNESFNALLKTLEEPPSHAYFILCTTDFEKLPKTVASRCTRIHFNKASIKELVGRLKIVVDSEKIETDSSSLELLAKYSDGSFRDGIKLLEQASSMGVVNRDNVMKVIGLNKDYPADRLLGYLEKKDTSTAIDWLNKANEANVNFKLLIQDIIERLRGLMLKSFGLTVGQDIKEYVFTLDEIKLMVKLFQQAYVEIKQAVISSLPLEMAVIEYSLLTGGRPQDDTKATEEKGEKKLERDKGENDVTDRYLAQNSNDKNLPRSIIHDLEGSWSKILEEVKPMNHSVLAFLRASRPMNIDERGNLTIEVFYKFHKDQLEKEQSRRIFEKAAGQVLAMEVKLRCVLGEGKPKVTVAEEPIYEVRLDTPPLPKKSTDDIIDIAEQIFNGGGTIQ